jgi:internalin A
MLFLDASNDDEKLTSADLIALLPDILKMRKLESLLLVGNQFAEIPHEIINLSKLGFLFIDERQLKHSAAVLVQLKKTNLSIWTGKMFNHIPLEISSKFENGQELLDYYFKTLKGESRELNEAKVLVVGEANVGKTSLIVRLITKKYDPKRNPTKGIQIYKDWKVPVNGRAVQLNVWDFGGQEIMHATHQFFLTKRSLYILMLDATVDKDANRVEYWLEKIRILGGGSPVVIVTNKIDLHQLDINQTKLLKDYPNIKGFHEVSCENGAGLDKLKAALVKEVGVLGGIHDALPKSWFAVKEELEKTDADFISNDKYEEICRAKEVDEKDWERLIELLHDLGVVLSFRDDRRVQETSVLNPEWVTQGVYDIINSRELFKTKGVLTRKMLAEILNKPNYPVKKQLFIVDMMRKFELCFDIRENEEFLVPDLLSEDELNTGNWDDSLRFEYQYNILFGSIITRFIVKMHKSISKTTYWRTGVVLEFKIDEQVKNEALVVADTLKRKITVAIRGNEHTRREFLSRIREKFEEIYDSFPDEFKKNVSERAPIPQNPEVSVAYKHLLFLEERGEEFYFPEGLDEQVSVGKLLNGIESKTRRDERRKAEEIREDVGGQTENRKADKSKKKVFIVHGHDGESKEKVARFVERMELEAIILHEQASGGKTIIEKIEEYSQVNFAIVLLTPDDVGGLAKNAESILPRARQNVIAELGYMMARLGRDKICLLNKGVEIPSDFHAIVCVELDDGDAWKIKLAQEMKKAGLEIDMNKLY